MVSYDIMQIFTSSFRFCRKKASLILVAFMLGMSNVILEEDRMVHDTRATIEQQQVQEEDDNL